MCHRILNYVLNKQCGHRTFIGDQMIDCMKETCGNSREHPTDCQNCSHNKWYGHPERIIVEELDKKCENCLQ